MFTKLVTTQWAELAVILTAISFNMYSFQADKGVYTIGSLVHKYKLYIETLNWLLFVALIIHLAYLFSWFLLIALFLLPLVGASVASCFRGFTPLVYLITMPPFLIIFLVKTFNN